MSCAAPVPLGGWRLFLLEGSAMMADWSAFRSGAALEGGMGVLRLFYGKK